MDVYVSSSRRSDTRSRWVTTTTVYYRGSGWVRVSHTGAEPQVLWGVLHPLDKEVFFHLIGVDLLHLAVEEFLIARYEKLDLMGLDKPRNTHTHKKKELSQILRAREA